jgi:TonB-dependent starch-binding outer membrane protein SusC
MSRAGSALLAVALATGCAGTGSVPSPSPAVNPAPEDQVSVGYATQSRRNVTGAVASYTPTDADGRVGRVEFMLQGRVPGLEVVPLPNGNYTLRIRGVHGLRGRATDDEPLLVIDDIPAPQGSLASALAGLAPRDVARIDVLKDGGAAAVYGSRGANGVIIITTKRAP